MLSLFSVVADAHWFDVVVFVGFCRFCRKAHVMLCRLVLDAFGFIVIAVGAHGQCHVDEGLR